MTIGMGNYTRLCFVHYREVIIDCLITSFCAFTKKDFVGPIEIDLMNQLA